MGHLFCLDWQRAVLETTALFNAGRLHPDEYGTSAPARSFFCFMTGSCEESISVTDAEQGLQLGIKLQLGAYLIEQDISCCSISFICPW